MHTVRAPGRVNLIGEHTDYNSGFVLPAAIDLATDVTLIPRHDDQLVIHSATVGATVRLDLKQPLRPRGDWSDYVAGVIAVLLENGCRIDGADLTIVSTVPHGAGLSSSAALEVATAGALLAAIGHSVDRLTIARWCQRAENEFVGARCGIMDQYVACFAQRDHAILLDCRSLESHTVPLPSDLCILVVNTMVKHSIAAGEYNARRAECEQATAILAQFAPHVRSLRDVTRNDLATQGPHLPPTLFKRVRHSVTENERVLQLAEALRAWNLPTVGRLMAESHQSLRDDYEVSCAELDLMVDLVSREPDVIGTRMTGGGFGGCTVSLVRREGAERLVRTVQERYQAATGTRPEAWISRAASGVMELTS